MPSYLQLTNFNFEIQYLISLLPLTFPSIIDSIPLCNVRISTTKTLYLNLSLSLLWDLAFPSLRTNFIQLILAQVEIMPRTQFSRNTVNPIALNWLCTRTSQIGKFALTLLWRLVHFIISICLAVLGVVDVVDSHLISSGLLKRYNVKSLKKPKYLAIVMDSEEAQQISKIIQLLQWLADIGVKNVCLYDEEGTLKKSKDIIMEKLSYVRLFEEAYDADDNTMSLEFASQYDGKDAVARAANLLLMKQMKMSNMDENKDDNIFTEAQMSEALEDAGCRGPEPELLLVYGPVRCHLGFPAWRLRYTEIVHMGPLNSMRYGSLVKTIYEYSLVHQNYGK